MVTIPSEFSVGASTTCVATSGSCSSNNGTFTISSVGLGLSNFNVVLGNIMLPFIAVSSSSFSV